MVFKWIWTDFFCDFMGLCSSLLLTFFKEKLCFPNSSRYGGGLALDYLCSSIESFLFNVRRDTLCALMD